MHDDRLGGADPSLDLRNGRVTTGPPQSTGGGLDTGHAPSASPPSLPALGEILVHVLSKVPQQGELLVQGGGHLVGGHAGQVVALAKLYISETITISN